MLLHFLAETVEVLERYGGGGSSSVNLTQALAEAEAILEQLKGRNFTAAQRKAEEELAEARRLRERVEALVINGTAQLEALTPAETRLEDLRRRMEDMQRLVERQARQPVTQVRPATT